MSYAPQPLRRVTLRLPPVLTVVALVGLVMLTAPVVALIGKTSWSDFPRLFTTDSVREVVWITVSSALLATLITTLVGVPLSLALQSWRRGATLARVLVVLPLALPPVVGGMALTALLGRRGLLAPVLDLFGIHFAFSFSGVVAAHVFVALPFVVVAVDAALRQLDREIVEAAAGIGLSPWQVTTRVILPTIKPAILTGAGLALARSLGEFGTTITFAGSLPGVTRTLPTGIYLSRETDPALAYPLAMLLLGLAVLSLAVTALIGIRFHRPEQAHILGDINVDRLAELSQPVTLVDDDFVVDCPSGSVRCPAHTVTAVIGPNGAGKSTLLGFMGGRLAGADLQLGENLSRLPVHRRGCVLVTQHPGLPPQATVRQAVAMAADSIEHADQLLTAAGLTVLADIRCGTLSGGQAAQVSLLRALAARPQVLLLDEPFAALDVVTQQRWRELIARLAPTRVVVLITHNPFEVRTLAGMVVVVDGGKITASGDTSKLLALPPNAFVAEFSGMNRLTGRLQDIQGSQATVVIEGGTVHGQLAADPANYAAGAVVTCVVAADNVSLTHQNQSAQVGEETCPVTVVGVNCHGASTTVQLLAGSQRLCAALSTQHVVDLQLVPGMQVCAVFAAAEVTVV